MAMRATTAGELDPSAARYPFDEASVAEARRLRSEPNTSTPLQFRLRRQIHTLPFLSPASLLFVALALLAVLHAASIWLFTRGFLLSRESLAKINDCSPFKADGSTDASCSMKPTHSKLVFLIVDALRADFVLPSSSPSAFHHNHITLPTSNAVSSPSHSFLSHFIADPPTTTLQRLQGLTTGTLPTFIDVGSNFGGQTIVEDNWLAQAQRHGRRLAFVGDDTWVGAFPPGNGSVWGADVRPFDSFNVEDLDTVDDGVRHHLLRHLSAEASGEWDILIAHSLGLDHAGHRFGASHFQTTRKLKETQALLEEVVDRLDDETLLVVCGDHGMTASGDHGGDSREEVDAILWVYSKGAPITSALEWAQEEIREQFTEASKESGNLGDRFTIPWDDKGVKETRSVSQVDLVPTISLLLGLPIPFGSLGLPIPELFYRPSTLPSATPSAPSRKAPPNKKSLFGRSAPPEPPQIDKLTPLQTLLQSHLLVSSQLAHYISTYTSLPSGTPLRPFLPSLHFQLSLAQSAYKGTFIPDISEQDRLERERNAVLKFWKYARTARMNARSVWAKFDLPIMGLGVAIWVASIAVGVKMFGEAGRGGGTRFLVGQGLEGMLAIAWAGLALALMGVVPGWMWRDEKWVVGALVTGVEAGVLLAPSSGSLWAGWSASAVLPVLVHSAAFASNSFIIFEDRVVHFLFISQLLFTLAKSLAAPSEPLRKRLVGYSLISLACVKAISSSSVCREEQGPECASTFSLSPITSTTTYWAVLGLSIGMSWFLPTVLRRFLRLSKSDQALAPVFLEGIMRPILLASSAYWTFDHFIAAIGDESGMLGRIKTQLARTVLVGSTLVATAVWYNTPLCLTIQKEERRDEAGNVINTQVRFIGFANSFGAAYLLFLSAVFGLLYLVSPPVGQLVLGLQLVTLLCLLEIFDAERDAHHLRTSFTTATLDELLNNELTSSPSSHSGPSFSQLSTLALLSHVAFFGTGHQAVLSSIQWSTAFVGFPTVVYPFSPLLVLLNTLSAPLLTALTIPLYAFWTLSPTLPSASQPPSLVLRSVLKASLGYMIYHAVTGLSAALWAAYFRRHLMVWKVFAPRYMTGALVLAGTEVVLVGVAVAWGALRTVRKVQKTLGTNVSD